MAETRAEHMQWAKERAIELVDSGDVMGGWTSMVSDLQKHEKTRNHSGVEMGMLLIMGGHLDTAAEMKKFIEGFN